MSSPRTLNPPAGIVPLESWEDSTSVAHMTDVTIASGSFIPLRVKILQPMPGLPACGRPTRTSPTVSLPSISSQPASLDMGDPQQQIPASFSELDGDRGKSQMEQGSVEEKPLDVNQVTVGGENEAAEGSLDIAVSLFCHFWPWAWVTQGCFARSIEYFQRSTHGKQSARCTFR